MKKVKLIQTGVKLQSLVVSVIIPSLKKSGPQMYIYMQANIKFCFHNIKQLGFSPLNADQWR